MSSNNPCKLPTGISKANETGMNLSNWLLLYSIVEMDFFSYSSNRY